MQLHPTGRFDNQARDYRHILAHPLAAAMGAEIRGVDVAKVTDAQFEEILHALFQHKMIFFRDQNITHADHAAFSLRFGPFAEDAYTQGVPGFRDVQPVIKEEDDKSAMIFGSGWHTDSAFLSAPPAISTLYAVDIPPLGGDTIWANSALAYAMLSDKMRELVAGLRVHMSMRDVLRSAQENVEQRESPIGRLAATRGTELTPELAVKVRGNFHPLVRTHPVTGEKALYCDGTYAIGIEGLRPEESAPLLGFLAVHITQHAFTCRLRWEPKTLTLWDNRLCVHQAFNDYEGFRREMYRTTIAGEVPQ
jgi:alpha-ketoglutarate-dependent taurine dioxygenase